MPILRPLLSNSPCTYSYTLRPLSSHFQCALLSFSLSYANSLIFIPTLSISQYSFLFLALHAPPLRAISTAIPVLTRTLSYMY